MDPFQLMAQQAQTAEAAFKALQTENAALKQEQATWKKEEKKLKKDVVELKKTNKTLRSRDVDITTELQAVKNHLVELIDEEFELRRKNKDVKDRLQALKAHFDELGEQVVKIEGKVSGAEKRETQPLKVLNVHPYAGDENDPHSEYWSRIVTFKWQHAGTAYARQYELRVESPSHFDFMYVRYAILLKLGLEVFQSRVKVDLYYKGESLWMESLDDLKEDNAPEIIIKTKPKAKAAPFFEKKFIGFFTEPEVVPKEEQPTKKRQRTV